MDVTSMLDRVADRLEAAGRFREAEDVDVLSNTIEAAGWRPLPTRNVGGVPLTERKIGDPKGIKERGDKPSRFDVAKEMVDRHIDERNVAIGAVKAGMERYGRILDEIAREHPDVAPKAREYKKRVSDMAVSVERQLKDFLLYLMQVKGGPEVTESMVDYQSS